MESSKEPEEWSDAMDRRCHEDTYTQFLSLLKWSVVGIVIALIVVAWAMT